MAVTMYHSGVTEKDTLAEEQAAFSTETTTDHERVEATQWVELRRLFTNSKILFHLSTCRLLHNNK